MADSDKLSFVELMGEQPSYGPLVDIPGKRYDLTALTNGTYWSLAIKGDQPDLPYVTIELISDDGKTIVRAVRKVDYTEDELSLLKPQKIGTYGPDKTLRDLCQIADEVFREISSKDVKWQLFGFILTKKLGFNPELDIITNDPHYRIDVKYETDRGQFRLAPCFLGTQNMTMLFDPPVQSGNLSAFWKCDPSSIRSSVINLVTEHSDDPTYMQLGAQLSTNPATYNVVLEGTAQDFTFLTSRRTFNLYAIFTTTDGDTMAYLQPRSSTGDIVAVAQMEVPFVFRLTSQAPPTLCQSINHETDSTSTIVNPSGCRCM